MKEVFLQHHSRGFWQRFHSPEQTIEAHTPEEVLPALARIERLVEENAWYAVGFVTYDAAPGFDCALRVVSSGAAASLPLLSFGLYTAPEILHASRLFPDPQSASSLSTAATQPVIQPLRLWQASELPTAWQSESVRPSILAVLRQGFLPWL